LRYKVPKWLYYGSPQSPSKKKEPPKKMDIQAMQASAERASNMMKLLGHPHRLMILCIWQGCGTKMWWIQDGMPKPFFIR